MIEILIRRAEEKDFLSIQRLLSTYFLDIEGLEPENFVLAERGGKVIGCAALIKSTSGEKSFLELHSIAVHPNFRGKRIGTRLIGYLIKNLGGPYTSGSLHYELYVRTTAPVFFEKLGFIQIQDTEKLFLWKDCKECELFKKCAQHAMKYSRL